MWICQCSCGTIKSVSSQNLRRNISTNCGCKATISIGEQKVKNILDNYNINYVQEYRVKELNNKRYDFAIFDKANNLICFIEYDGRQHYNNDSWGGENGLLERQKADKEKDEYAKQQNIKMVRIPYWEIDNIEYLLKQ